MNSQELRDTLAKITPRVSNEQFARIFRIAPHSARKWLNGHQPVPFAVYRLVEFVAEGKLTLADICPHERIDDTGTICLDCDADLLGRG